VFVCSPTALVYILKLFFSSISINQDFSKTSATKSIESTLLPTTTNLEYGKGGTNSECNIGRTDLECGKGRISSNSKKMGLG
jgi:hypothetical protein